MTTPRAKSRAHAARRRKNARGLLLVVCCTATLAVVVTLVLRDPTSSSSPLFPNNAILENSNKVEHTEVKRKRTVVVTTGTVRPLKKDHLEEVRDELGSIPEAPACPEQCPTKSTVFKMAAIPHTASTSTDRLFRETALAWHNTTLSYKDQGFRCPGNQTIVEYSSCPSSSSLVPCILNSFQYTSKSHTNYMRLKKYQGGEVFTVLRNSGQFVMSQYGMRKTWDKQFPVIYPGQTLDTISVEEWVEKAWWRHNLFTKLLATDTEVIWAGTPRATDKPLLPTKEESDRENALGRESIWFQNALQQLKEMPLFGFHHRLAETFALMGFRFCVPVAVKELSHKKDRVVTSELDEIVKERFKLDALLLEEAEPLFDEMIRDMQEKKARGIVCDLGSALKQPDFRIGLQCQ